MLVARLVQFARMLFTEPRRALALPVVALWMLYMVGSHTLQKAAGVVSYQTTSASLRAGKLRNINLDGGDCEHVKNKTLVVYVYHESSEVYAENLAFFVKNGVGKEVHPSVDYLIIVNGETKVADFSHLPPEVLVVRRGNTCYDGGAMGEVLDKHAKLWMYKYYVLMNSSVRGPFLPRYWPASLPWTAAFTQLLKDRVKLVGTTISCQTQVHVQSMVLSTDNPGLRMMYEAGALDCPTTMTEAIQNYEFGSTNAILKRGFKIDCLMSRYANVDWSRDAHQLCNNGYNPQLDRRNDGYNVDPFELLFIKVKDFPLKGDGHVIRRISDYYMGRDDVATSGFDSPRIRGMIESGKTTLLAQVQQCNATFDGAFYKAHNPDLSDFETNEDLLEHFTDYGYEERRMYRFVADPEVLESGGKETREHCAQLQPDVP